MSDTHYVYKFYGRLGAEREQLLGMPELPESMFLELADLTKQFGEKWDIWIERFHRVHPHTQLQRRLDGFVREKPLTLKLAKDEGRVKGWIEGTLETP